MKKIISLTLLVGGLIIFAYFLFSNKKEAVQVSKPPQDKVASPSLGKKTLIIAFGDSLTAGYGLPLTESYPAQLEQALLAKGYSIKVVNAGVSGETTKGNSERANFIASQNPDIVLLGIGGNDALRALSLSDTEKNIRSTIEVLRKASSSPEVILLQIQSPVNSGEAYKRSFDGIYPKLAKEFSLTLVPFVTESLFKKEYLLPDGLHLTKEGYGIFIKEKLLPQIERYLKSK